MPNSFTQIFIHFVWATWDRMPLISAEREERLYACILKECENMRCHALAIGGIEDHVHVLLRMHATVSVAEIAQQMKGVSSHFVNHEMPDEMLFRWQGGYGALSVSPNHVNRVVGYIRNQKRHHAAKKLWPLLEDTSINFED